MINELTQITTVGQIMTTKVISVKPSDTMQVVSHFFRTHNIHHLPVVDKEGVLIGMISKSDYLAISNAFPLFYQDRREAFNDKIYGSLLVEEVMTKQLARLQPEDSILIAVGIFQENLFHALPVVNEHNKLVGIITTYDLLSFAFRDQMFLS